MKLLTLLTLFSAFSYSAIACDGEGKNKPNTPIVIAPGTPKGHGKTDVRRVLKNGCIQYSDGSIDCRPAQCT